jgi:hypothetical protein
MKTKEVLRAASRQHPSSVRLGRLKGATIYRSLESFLGDSGRKGEDEKKEKEEDGGRGGGENHLRAQLATSHSLTLGTKRRSPSCLVPQCRERGLRENY